MNFDLASHATQTAFFPGAQSDSLADYGKVLIVAERAQARRLHLILRHDDHLVASAESTEAALELCGELEPDLLLLDVDLPDVNVLEFCRQLTNAYGGGAPAVIFIADQSRPTEVVEGLAAGGIDFLSGPFRADEVLARIRVHLLNRQRLAQLKREGTAKQRLLCMAAHDLRNPLVSIRALTNLIRAGTVGAVTSAQRDLLDTIYDASQSTLDLVSELLDDSVHAAGGLNLTPRPISLAQLVEACVRLNNASAAQKASHIVLLPGRLPAVLSVDEPKIRQVLNNLLGNAIKFSPPGSMITVATDRTADDCIVAVRDQGPGIRPAERARLFRDFSRASAKPTGGESSIGLGLSICHKIMQAHNGAIEVHDAPDGGAEFRITLPIGP